MSSPNEKVVKALSDYLSHYTLNEVYVAGEMTRESYFVQAKFMNIILSYIMFQARNYELGLIPAEQYEIVRLCKQIKDNALQDYVEDDPNPYLTGRGQEYISG